MNLRRTWTILLACGLAALAVAPASASAKPGYFVSPGYRWLSLHLQGSNGYDIQVSRWGRYVQLFTHKEPSMAIYLARSLEPKRSRIEAKYPGLGRISLRFRPQGTPQKESTFFPGCKGGEIVEQPGYFVGVIRFRGEQGYTSVHGTRARGEVVTTAKEVCKRSIFDDDPDSGEDRIELHAYSRSNGRIVAFSGSGNASFSSSMTLSAFVLERRRGMTISRDTFVTGKESDIAIGDTRPFPLSATVTPPKPFTGSAEYQRVPGGENVWSGSLAVSFPGLGRIALAGPSFSALLCQLPGCSGPTVDGHRLPLTQPKRSITSISSRWLSRTNSASAPSSMSPSLFIPR